MTPTTKTDREHSLQADEFLWDTSQDTEVHSYVGPILNRWLKKSEGKSLLDLGCGNGALTSKIEKLGLKCVGTDFSSSGISIAKKAHPLVDFFQSTMDAPLPDEHHGKYDIVMAVEVIEHLLLPRQLFARAKEALKPGGTMIVTTPYHGYLKNIMLAFVNKYDSHWHPLRDYGHIKFFSIATLGQIFTEEGFEVDEIVRVGRLPPLARSMMFKAILSK